MSDLISRADAIEAVHEYFKDRMGKSKCDYDEELQVYVISKEERTMLTYNKGINDKLRSLPSADAEQGFRGGKIPPKEMLNGTVLIPKHQWLDMERELAELKEKFESADAEPKWNCTANFVAEQLDRLRKMTDEEKWEFFRKFFSMGDAVQGEWKHTITWQPYCSNCEFVFGEDEEFSPFWKYCPMCGARMENK